MLIFYFVILLQTNICWNKHYVCDYDDYGLQIKYVSMKEQ